MKKCLLIVCLSVVCWFHSSGGTVQWNTVTYSTDVPGGFPDSSANAYVNISLLFDEGQSIDYGLFLNTAINGNQAALTASTSVYLVSWGSHWRTFEQGDYVDYGRIFGNYDDYFFVSDNGVRSDRNLILATGQSIYLGFSLDGEYPFAYGWVQLGFDGTAVYVVNSAVDIGGNPIQVGLIPEPAAVGLLFAGGVALLLRRKRRKPCRAENNEADCQNSFLSNSRNGGIT